MPGLVVVSVAQLLETVDGDVFMYPHPALRLVRRGSEDIMGVRTPTTLKELPSGLPADGTAAFMGDENEGGTKYLVTSAEGGWLATMRGGMVWLAPLTAKAKAKPGKVIPVEQFCIESV